jgi:uncharacterized repeat protein (TIGR04076 family)
MAEKVEEVRAKVVSVTGTCELGHRVGDVVVFTDTGVAGRICVHALYSMMPKVFAMMFNADFPWARDHPDTLTHPCPDAANPVVFELTRRRKRTHVGEGQKSGGASRSRTSAK